MFGLARLTIGIRKPRRKIPGFDVSGEIVAIGEEVTLFDIGDQVFGGTVTGGNAEFCLALEQEIALKPSNLSYKEASGLPMAGLSALQALRSLNIQKGDKILIYGASGGIGTYALQLAKEFGAQVTAVSSGKNETLVRKLGAEIFIDYQKVDFTELNEKYDFIFDTVAKVKNWKCSLKENGIFINAGSPSISMIVFFGSQLGNKFRKKKYTSFNTKYLKKDLECLGKLAEEGKLTTIIDRTFKFEELAQAHEQYELGHTAGKLIVQIAE